MARKIIKYALLIISVLIIVCSAVMYVLVEHFLPYSSIRPYRITRDDAAKAFTGKSIPSDFGLSFDKIDVVVQDSIHLIGWFIKSPAKKINGTVVLLHGIASCKESWLVFADTLSRNGYNVVLYDSRAHGESGGIDCTFGYFEKYDVSSVIHEIKIKYKNTGSFAVLGHSMGAAVALQAMAIDTAIVCGVVESSFAALREILYDSWRQMSGSPDHFIPDAVIKKTEHIAGFSIDQVDPEKSAGKIFYPVLVIHGDADKKISINYGRRIYDNLKAKKKEWYAVKNGDHDHLGKIGGKELDSTIIAFLNKNLK